MLKKTIGDILNEKGEKVVTIKKGESLIDASKKMDKEKVGTLIVMDGKNMAGIVSERDIVRKAIANKKDPAKSKVEDIMTEKVVYATKTEQIQESIAKMAKQKCRHLPVLENKEIIGMISISDLMKTMSEDYQVELDVMKDYVSGVYVR